MRGFIAYSQPRGKYGRYILTVMLYFSETTEEATIEVRRGEVGTYSCGHCGKWASIAVSNVLSPTEHQKKGLLELYRYDRVEPEDDLLIWLHDSELLRSQLIIGKVNPILIGKNSSSGISLTSYWHDAAAPMILQEGYQRYYRTIKDYQEAMKGAIMTDETSLYEIVLLNWDSYLQEQAKGSVEEELIQKTMNAEKITIKELQLEPARQLPAAQGQQQFIEGELRYLDT